MPVNGGAGIATAMASAKRAALLADSEPADDSLANGAGTIITENVSEDGVGGEL